MVDPISAGAGAIVAWKAVDLATGLLRRMLGPGADAAGELLKAEVEKIAERRAQRFAEAELMIEAAGLGSRPVAMKVLQPLLVGAGLEEDADLASKWSALIANAAVAEPEESVLPSFPLILSQLNGIEAAILDYLDTQPLTWTHGREPDGPGFALPDLARNFQLAPKPAQTYVGHLASLGLVDRNHNISYDSFLGDPWAPNFAPRVWISPFGARFVRACRAPRSL